MLNETNQTNGFIIFIVIAVIIIIIWVIITNNRTPDTHIHAKPIFDTKTNTLKIRRSIYGVNYKVVEEIFPEDSDFVSKGPDSTFVTHASIPNNQATGIIIVTLAEDTNILNTTVIVTKSSVKEEVINTVIIESLSKCFDNCLENSGRGPAACTILCSP